MGVFLTNPKDVPISVTEDWQPLLNINAAGNVGFNAISLTNWNGSTLAPAIAAGSMIEIDGSIALFDVEQAITGIATGINYLAFSVSGATVTPVWAQTAPAWNPAKNGWYSASGQRCSGHRVTLESSDYYYKNKIRDGYGGLTNIPDYADPAGRYAQYSLPDNGYWTPPAGGYMFQGIPAVQLQVNTGSGWDGWVTNTTGVSLGGGLFVFDGVNFRFWHYINSGSAYPIRYRRLW